MESTASRTDSLFKVFLRLRPPHAATASGERFLTVEPPAADSPTTAPTHVTLTAPSNGRKHSTDKYCFTQVLEEDASQLDVFHCTDIVKLIEGVLAPHGGEGTDALVATLGYTGSGKTHTILGSKSQRGMTQLALDVIFRSIGQNVADARDPAALEASIKASDPSEADVRFAPAFLETVFSDINGPSRASSRAPTPMLVRNPNISCISAIAEEEEQQGEEEQTEDSSRCSVGQNSDATSISCGLGLPGAFPESPKSVRLVRREDYIASLSSPLAPPSRLTTNGRAGHGSPLRPKPPVVKNFMIATLSTARKNTLTKTEPIKGESTGPPPTPRRLLARPPIFPVSPDVSGVSVSSDPTAEYVVLVSMYELYNNAIHDLLTPPIKVTATKDHRRQLQFKETKGSQEQSVVVGLRKIICTDLNQALMVLEAGLHGRSVASTMSNRTSSRSHGFFCVEVKKRRKSRSQHGGERAWGGSTLTILDLAGSERAREAKTAGSTLAEAGKINESLMYFGQCLQMFAAGTSSKAPTVSVRHCKLTEILFSNSFGSMNASKSHSARRPPQKGVLIVTADPTGDFNATNSIFRYSALAREVMAPRVPSITQALKAAAAAKAAQPSPQLAVPSSELLGSSPPLSSPPQLHNNRPYFPPGPGSSCYSPNVQRTFSPISNVSSSDDRATMEAAALEIARQAEEIEYMRDTLEMERARRVEAESRLFSLEDRLMELEQEIREECVADFEQRLAVELARWNATLELEKERGEEHWDRKIEVYERMQVTGPSPSRAAACDEDDKENVLVETLSEENERLQRELKVLRRELTARSPTKRRPLMERDDLAMADDSPGSYAASPLGASMSCSPRAVDGDSLRRKMEGLRVADDPGRGSGASSSSRTNSNGSPKKARKLAAKRWDVATDADDTF